MTKKTTNTFPTRPLLTATLMIMIYEQTSGHATQLTTQKQNELAQVSADMAKEREKTDTYARNVLTMAEAQAAANRKVADSLTSNLVQYEALKHWDGKLPTFTGGGAIPFINVNGKQ